jgi:hypothetical protein
MNLSDDKFYMLGNFHAYQFNRKLCFQAQDQLFDCVDQ